MTSFDADYAAFWCEENVWHLAHRAEDEDWLDARAVFISSPNRCVAMFDQRAAPQGEPIVWDYHVVLWFRAEDQWWTIDLDSRSGPLLALDDWLDASFPVPELIPDELAPTFRIVPAAEFLETFHTDRSHMLDENGTYRADPPSWEPLHQDSNLWHFVAPQSDAPGIVMDLSGVRETFD